MAATGKLQKTKSILNFKGFDYIPQGQRKDGSSTWRCLDRDCEGRILKKGEGEHVEVLKDHSIELPSIKAAVIHLGMNCIKERALNNPHESEDETIKHGMTRASELMIASMPSPSVIEASIAMWKNPAFKEKTPRPKEKPEGRTRKPLKLPRKRVKLSSPEKLLESDEHEDEDSPKRSKRSRSQSADLSESDN